MDEMPGCEQFEAVAGKALMQLVFKAEPLLVAAGDEARTGRGAGGGAYVGPRTFYSLPGEGIDVCGLYLGIAVQRDIEIAQVVCHQDNDVRREKRIRRWCFFG